MRSLLIKHINYTSARASSGVAGFKYLEPSIGGLIGLLEIIIAAVFSIWLFGDTLTPSLLVGSGLIVLAAGLVDGWRVTQRVSNHS